VAKVIQPAQPLLSRSTAPEPLISSFRPNVPAKDELWRNLAEAW